MPFHVGHHIVKQTIRLTRIENRQYVIMRESCCHFDFAQKSFGANFRRDFRTQDFYGDRTLVAQIAGKVDDSHPSFTQFSLHRVAAGKS